MYASVNTAQIQPGQLDQAIRTIQEQVNPIVKQLPGLQSVSLMVDRSANTLVTIATYDTLEHAQIVPSGALLEAMGPLNAVLSGRPERKWYEVVA